MARKTPARTADDIPPAMDYAQHQATYEVFLTMVKWGIISSGVIVVALYFFIIADLPILGALLLLALPVGAAALFVMRGRSAD